MDSTPSPSEGTASSFSQFPRFATEIRLQIWSDAINAEPRVLTLRYLPERDSCVCNTPVPSLLHVNRESRYEALRVYKLIFGTSTAEPKTYIAPNTDIVYLPRYREMGYDETLRDFRDYLRNPAECDMVHSLGLDFVESDVQRPWEAYDKAVLIKSFAKLKKLYVVLRSVKDIELSEPRGEKEITFVKPMEQFDKLQRIMSEFLTDIKQELLLMDELSRDRSSAIKSWKLPDLKVVAIAPVHGPNLLT